MRALLLSVFVVPLAFAAAANYSYDAAGRLIKGWICAALA